MKTLNFMRIDKIQRILFIVLCILPVCSYSQNLNLIKDQRLDNVKLLESTIDDLNKIFGKDLALADVIKVKNGSISFEYSLGRCSEKTFSEWDVAKGTVIGINFYPKDDIKLSSIKLNLTDFSLKFESMHVPSLYSYFNDKTGVKYIVEKGENPNGVIQSVEYYPSDKFDFLKCVRDK